MSRKITALLFTCFFVSVTTTAGIGEDWGQFRGPNGDAKSTVSGTPTFVGPGNTQWQTSIPGTGWSSPVVGGNQIWLTTAETTEATAEQIAAKTRDVQFAKIKTVAASVRLRAICVDADSGKILHNIVLRNIEDPDLINPLNSYASPTPVIAGGRVVCHFGSYGTWCLDRASSEVLWRTALVIDHSVGPGSSPIVSGNTIVLACDGIDKQFVAGLDLETGKTTWTTNRPTMRATNGEFRKAYSTPLLITVGGQSQAVIPGSQWVCSYDPSTGREIWRADFGDGFSTTPMAVFESGLVVCSTGYMKAELVALSPKGTGDISSEIAWRAKKGGSTMPTAVPFDGNIYSISDDGILSILDAASGDLRQRVRVGGKFASSPLVVSDLIYLGNQDGAFTVMRLGAGGSKPEKLSTNRLDGSIMASPALIGSDLVIRTSKSLMRVKGR